MNKTIIVGDIHGKNHVVKQLRDSKLPIIFVGDFLDSFHESPAKQIECVEIALKMVKDGQAQITPGNHEYSYLMPRKMRCSGYKGITDSLFSPLAGEFTKVMKPFIKLEPNIIITHAGIDNTFWQREKLSLSNLQRKIETAMTNQDSWYYKIGFYRGGDWEVGGPLWCDWNAEFTPVEGIKQVVGHTRYHATPKNFDEYRENGVRTNPNGDWCIDNLDRNNMVLEYSDGTLKPVDLDDISK